MFACRLEAQHETLGRNVHHVGCDTCECVRVRFYYLTAWFHYFWFYRIVLELRCTYPIFFFFQAPFTVTRVSVSRETAGSAPLAVSLEEMHGRKIVALLWQPQPCWFPGCFVPALGVSHRHTHFTVYMRCNGPLINSKTIPTHSKSKSCDVSKKSDNSTVISDNVTLIFFSLLTNNEMLRKHLWSI